VLGPPRRRRRRARRTSSSTSPAGVRVDEPGADLAVALAIAARPAAWPSGDGRHPSPASASGAHGRAALRRAPGPRLAEAAKFGLSRCSRRTPRRRCAPPCGPSSRRVAARAAPRARR
jgi:hypothetical protein